MTRKGKAASGQLAATRRRDAGAFLQPLALYSTRTRAKTQTAPFDKTLSRRLDCTQTLADIENSPLWGWVLRAYRRRLERAIPAR